MYCSYCKGIIADTDLFCSHCGKGVGKINEASEYYCTECEKSIPADAAYCWNCGASMGNENSGTVNTMQPAPGEEKVPLKFKTLKANKKIVEESVCKVCNKKFTIGDDVTQCENCHSFYHSVCWNNSGGCNQPTCKDETKKCPFCGEEIKKSALKCRYCGNYLDESLKVSHVHKGKLKEASSALTYAIVGIFCFGIILGPIAISKGSKAMKIIDSEPGWEGRGSAKAAVIIGWIDVVFFILGIIIRLSSI